MNIRVEGVTRKNTRLFEKPNEDYFIYDACKGNIVLLDGVSRDKENGIYPNPSPAYEVSKMIANYYMTKFGEEDNKGYLAIVDERKIKKVLEEGNQNIRKYNDILNHEFPAGTVGIFLALREDILYYAYIGDCSGIIIRNGKKEPFTYKQTINVHRHKKELTTKQIRYEICNNIMHPYGYGVLDGNPGALDFVVTGIRKLLPGDTVVLYTDGLDEVVDGYTPDQLLECDINEFVSDHSEKNADDRTMVRICFDPKD